MSEYLKQLMQDFTFLEGCQALVNKDDYIDYCEHCEYQCRQFNVVKKFINYGMELERENKILKEQLEEFKKTLRDKLIKYFDVENDSYFYILTRDKSAYQYGTMRFDDFKEFDMEQIDDLINFLFNKRSDE